VQFVKYTRNGRAYFFQTPQLGSTAAAAAMAALYVKSTKGWRVVEENPALIKGMSTLFFIFSLAFCFSFFRFCASCAV
jgi:hypothetical protein